MLRRRRYAQAESVRLVDPAGLLRIHTPITLAQFQALAAEWRPRGVRVAAERVEWPP